MKNILLLVLIVGLTECNERRPPQNTGREGTMLPSFKLLLSDSSTYFDTGTIPRGKPIVLLYVSPRCPYCRAQIDGIVGNMSSLKNIRFYIFTTWPFNEMRDFSKHYELNKYENIVAGIDDSNFFIGYFSVLGVPYTAIYNPEKQLNKAFFGKISTEQIMEVTRQ